ncbi:MAG: hydroxyacid dehydrogenase [Clostridia bacterium]|nr:hydroxyacid dehydrogenase [Clostridia bacterium]
MKPKAIFASSREAIGNAYSESTKEKLSAYLEFLPGFYTPEVFRDGGAHPELRDVEYIFSTWGMTELTQEEIAALLPDLKAVFYAAGTVQAFARPFLARGVRIFSAWGANAVPVAEVTVAEIVLANKGFFRTMHRGGSPKWTEHNAARPHPGNFDTDVGIIGAGMIGSMVIEKLRDYRLNVKVFDPFLSDERAAALGAEKLDDLAELFARCHVISNHLANNPQTVGMIDRRCFERMGDNAVFINTGRGQQVVEADMIAALKEKPGRTAILDVTWPEPPAAGSELYTMSNVILTPHNAGSIGSEVARMGEYMLAEFEAYLSGTPTKYGVTEKMLATMA